MNGFDSGIHARRRALFLEQLGAAAAVIPAATLATHHADCEWPFRQDSDFFYLTGFDEPDAVALLLPHRPEGERFVLFVQPKELSDRVRLTDTPGALQHGASGGFSISPAALQAVGSVLQSNVKGKVRRLEGMVGVGGGDTSHMGGDGSLGRAPHTRCTDK